MPHHHGGIIGEIEDEIIQIEQMALSGGAQRGMQQQPGMYVQQQPMGYAQGMYGQYGAPANVVQYAQPGYAVRPAYVGVQQPSPYGPGYVDAGDGRPAMVYGGAYEGVGAPVAAYQQPLYQAQLPPQRYAAAPAQGYAQGYPPAAQPVYGQAPQAAPQYAPQQAPPQAPQYPAPQGPQQAPQYGAPQAPQQPPQYAAPQAPQAAPPQGPQYAAAPQAPQAAAPQAPQYGAAPPAPQAPQGAASQPPQYPAASQASQPASQYAPASQPTQPQYAGSPPPNVQPAGPQDRQPSPQPPAPNQSTAQAAPPYSPGAQPSPTPQYAPQGSQYPQSYQSAAPPASPYAAPPQPSPQPQYAATALPPQQPAYGQVPMGAQPADTRGGLGPVGAVGLGVAAGGAAALGFAAYEHHHQAALQQNQQALPPQIQNPTYIPPQDTQVRFEPVSTKLDTHHHVMKALSHSKHSVPELSAIIGTYLIAKRTEGVHFYGVSGSRPEVQDYYHQMDKLEKLSADYVSKHSSSVHSWKEALGPHRRHVFADLYNRNELVRAFCQEMQGGVMVLPALDAYSLGTKLSNFHFQRTAVRQANLRASLSILAQVRTVVLVDDSYSMTEAGHASWGIRRNESRWQQTRNVLAGITPLVAAHNPHGVDLHFLNRVPFYAGLRTSQAAQSAFDSDRPNNGTPTGARVNDILDAYVSALRYYRGLLPLNLIVITDGEAQDEEILHRAIEHHVTELVHRGFPAHQFGVEFVQVGDCEHATRHLERLEKEVSRHHHKFQRDVVGVTPANRISNMDPEAMLAIAVSGVDARLNGYMRSRGVNV